MSKFKILFNNRSEHLEKQRIIDTHLAMLPCSNLIASYLLTKRHIGRLQYTKVKDGGLLHVYNNVQDSMDQDFKDIIEMEKIISAPNPCDELHKYLHTLPEAKMFLHNFPSSVSDY